MGLAMGCYCILMANAWDCSVVGIVLTELEAD